MCIVIDSVEDVVVANSESAYPFQDLRLGIDSATCLPSLHSRAQLRRSSSAPSDRPPSLGESRMTPPYHRSGAPTSSHPRLLLRERADAVWREKVSKRVSTLSQEQSSYTLTSHLYPSPISSPADLTSAAFIEEKILLSMSW